MLNRASCAHRSMRANAMHQPSRRMKSRKPSRLSGVGWMRLLGGFMLFTVCKIKKLLNSFNNRRALVLVFLIFFIVGRAYWGREIIFMLCKFEASQFTTFQVSTEYTTGFEVLGNGGANDVVSGSRFRFEPDQFIFESSKKIVGGFIEIISPGNVYAEEMIDKTAEQGAHDAKTASNVCYFKGSKFQFYLYAFLGGFIGIGIGVIIIWLFYFFTQ